MLPLKTRALTSHAASLCPHESNAPPSPQDGHVVTETERTTQHEEYDNESLPDSGSSLSDGSVHEEARETQHNIVHTKDEDLVEYYAVPRGGTLAQGVKVWRVGGGGGGLREWGSCLIKCN